MIVKKYIANTVEEAQKVIREELGPKATILTLRYVKQKGWRALFAADNVEVTAAIEEADLEVHTGKQLASAGMRRTEEALEDNLAALKRMMREASPEQEEPLATRAKPEKKARTSTVESPAASAPSTTTYGDPRMRSKGIAKSPKEEVSEVPQQRSSTAGQKLSPEEEQLAMRKLAALRRQAAPSTPSDKTASAAATSAGERTTDLKRLGKGLVERFRGAADESDTPPVRSSKSSRREGTPKSQAALDLEGLRAMIREELRGSTPPAPTARDPLSPEGRKDVRFLQSKGVDTALAETIVTAVDREASPGDPAGRINLIKRHLTGVAMTKGPLQTKGGAPTVVAIVGPTGVGKTTTLTKLASHYALTLGKRVAVISLDIIKVGAREQIRALTERIGCPLTVVTDAIELRAAVATHSDYDLILVDTAGQNQYHQSEVRALGRTLESVRGITLLLAISATTKDIDVYGTIQQFSCMNVDSLIITKLDETIAHGLLLNISSKTGKALRYLTDGQRLDDDLEVADGASIARSILVDHNERQYDEIRRLAGV